MADVKISELTELSEAPAASDLVPIVDVSASTTKKLTFTNLFSYITGAVSTLLTSNLTASRALISGSGGKIEAASVTSAEIAHLTGQTDYTNTRPVVNLIYNGNFDLWDLGTNFAGSTDDTYVLPGWNGLSSTTLTCSQQTSSPPAGSRYYFRFAVTTAPLGAGIVFFLEAQDAIPLREKTVSVSLYAKGDTTGTLKTAVATWGSTADSLTSDIVSSWGATPTLAANWTSEGDTSHSVTTNWTRFTHESIALDTASFNNIALFIYGYNQNITFDIAQVQLEIGTKATGFVARPVCLERKLALRRYWRMTGDASGNGPAMAGVATAGTQTFRNFIPFPVEMRATPTATVGGTWAVTNCGQPTLSKTSAHGSCLTVVSSASGVFSTETNSASGDYLEFNAEL